MKASSSWRRRLRETVYPLLAATDIVFLAWPSPRGWRAFTKPLLMPLLMPAAPDTRTRVALGAAGVGDVALMSSRPSLFVVGASSFAVSHIVYLGTFGPTRGWADPRRWDAVQRAVVPLSAAVTAAIAAAGNARRGPALAAVITGYGAVLTSMALAALADRHRPGEKSRAAGAGLFLCSDALLGVQLFVMSTDGPRRRLVGASCMATYTAAQWLLSSPERRRS